MIRLLTLTEWLAEGNKQKIDKLFEQFPDRVEAYGSMYDDYVEQYHADLFRLIYDEPVKYHTHETQPLTFAWEDTPLRKAMAEGIEFDWELLDEFKVNQKPVM